MRNFVCGALLAASVAGIAYLALAVQRTLAFAKRRSRAAVSDFSPPVTVLKPLRGDEPGLFDSLRSFCDQDYPEFQVVFGVGDPRDPAAGVARRVIEAYPRRDLSVEAGERAGAANRKIANVLNLMAHAKHAIIVVADSDIRVERTYLRSVAAPFADARAGAVTCLYRAAANGSPPLAGSQARATSWQRVVRSLAAMFIEEQFAPSVLVAIALSPMDFCLGATMAVTKDALEAIGGFEAIASYLADDQMLGKLVRAKGYRVELCPHVVETAIADGDLRELWQHELRWARTMHAAHPLGYSFSFLTYGLPLAIAYAVVCDPSLTSLSLVGLALGLRLVLHYASRATLESKTPDAPWLVLARDALGLAVWAAHFFGRSIRWRDERFVVDRTGRLQPID
jgi:ceramide glucosyltransferase